MAENSPPVPPPPTPAVATAVSVNPDSTRYWCYQCDKRVPVETLPDNPNIICYECKNGFVESISTPAFGNEFIQVLRLIAQAAREDDEPPPPPPPPRSDHPAGDNDYLRIELDGWDNGNYIVTDEEDQEYRDQVRARWYYDDDDDDDEDDDDDDNDDDNNNDNEQEEQIENQNERTDDENNEETIDNQNEQIEILTDDEIENNEEVRRERPDVFRLRLREVASLAASRRNHVLDWAEMLIGDDDEDVYIGNPGDYVDAVGYEALLQTLAESDSSRRGTPPAAKLVVENLHTVEVKSTCVEVCAVCKDKVFNNEGKIVKQLECSHMYHGECIIPWLDFRNTCPVCRYELPTDDPEYEEDRKRRLLTMAAAAAARADNGGCASSSGAGD